MFDSAIVCQKVLLLSHISSVSNDLQHVCRVFMALITALFLYARSYDSLLLVSVGRVHVVFSIAKFKSGGKPWLEAREATLLRIGIQKASRT